MAPVHGACPRPRWPRTKGAWLPLPRTTGAARGIQPTPAGDPRRLPRPRRRHQGHPRPGADGAPLGTPRTDRHFPRTCPAGSATVRDPRVRGASRRARDRGPGCRTACARCSLARRATAALHPAGAASRGPAYQTAWAWRSAPTGWAWPLVSDRVRVALTRRARPRPSPCLTRHRAAPTRRTPHQQLPPAAPAHAAPTRRTAPAAPTRRTGTYSSHPPDPHMQPPPWRCRDGRCQWRRAESKA